MSSRAYLVDLIHSIGEKTALADHLEEKLYGEEGVFNADVENILRRTLDLRREQMEELLEKAEKPNPEYWCTFKHAVKAFTMDMEVYEATLDEKDRQRALRSSEILACVSSMLLGMDFISCARCFYDRLLVQQHDSKQMV